MYRFLLLWVVAVFADWQSEQIAEDLSAFSKIHRADLPKVMKSLGPEGELAHIVIEKGDVRVKELVTTGWNGTSYRLKEVLRGLSRWQKSAKAHPSRRLPDCEFLLSLGDGLDTQTSRVSCDLEQLPLPVFVFCKRKDSKRLALFPDTGALVGRRRTVKSVRRGDRHTPWRKKREMLFWRGAGSDGFYTLTNWTSFPRAKLVLLARNKPDLVDAGFTALPQMASRAALDAVVEKTGEVCSFVSPEDHVAYKYLMDIDGNSNGWDRCFWGLLSESVLIKQESPYCQWYYKALEPGRHYIGVRRSLEDLEERIAWAKNNDQKACAIAKEASALAKSLFRRSAVFGYIRELLIEYNSRFEDTCRQK